MTYSVTLSITLLEEAAVCVTTVHGRIVIVNLEREQMGSDKFLHEFPSRSVNFTAC